MNGNEEEDDFGRCQSHPFVARTMKNKKLSEAALTFQPSSPRHPRRGSWPRQVFLITRQDSVDQARSEPSLGLIKKLRRREKI